MIRAADFLGPARVRGLDWYAGVPCSFFAPFVDAAIADPALVYLGSANEGDALASAVGATLGGRGAVALMQNSGLGNAVNPLTSLAWPFRVPILLVVTWRGDPKGSDEPQHRLMGRITGRLLEAMEIPWEVFPTERGAVESALERAGHHFRNQECPYALVMRKGTVEPLPAHPDEQGAPRAAARGETLDSPARHERATRVVRRQGLAAAARPTRGEALRRLVELTPQNGETERTVLIASTGHTGRELFALADRPSHLYMVGSMGCASSLGLGLALARPDVRVVVLDGDGALLMRMGNLATIGAHAAGNFVHVVLDNGMHASTGGQPTVSAGVSFAEAAMACGYAAAWEGDDLQLFDSALARSGEDAAVAASGARTGRGPRLLHLRIRPGSPPGLPRPDLPPDAVKRRLRDYLGEAR